MAGTVGFEPTTNSLEGYCSIQLSYAPILFGAPSWTRTKDTTIMSRML